MAGTVIVPNTERIKLSNGQLAWVRDEHILRMPNHQEHHYGDLWLEVEKGQEVTAINSLSYICESAVDRATYGDNDAESRRDKAFGLRIMAKIRKAEK